MPQSKPLPPFAFDINRAQAHIDQQTQTTLEQTPINSTPYPAIAIPSSQRSKYRPIHIQASAQIRNRNPGLRCEIPLGFKLATVIATKCDAE